MNVKSVSQKVAATAALASASAMTFAQETGPDYASLADSVDFGTVAAGVLAIAGVLLGARAIIRGARMVIGMLR